MSKNTAEQLIGHTKGNKYLRSLTLGGGKKMIIPACEDGIDESIYKATQTFNNIDPDFKQLDFAQPGVAKTEVRMYQTKKDEHNLKKLFLSLDDNLENLTFDSQKQIVKFCEKYKDFLPYYENGHYTAFLFNEKMLNNGNFVFLVKKSIDGLDIVYVHLEGCSQLLPASSSGEKFLLVVPVNEEK